MTNDASILYGLGGGPDALETSGVRGVDGAEGLQLIDFNGDGHLDMAATQMITNRPMVFQGNGRGQFTPPGSYGVTGFPEDFLAGDFDGDGCQDLAVPGNLPPVGPPDVGVAVSHPGRMIPVRMGASRLVTGHGAAENGDRSASLGRTA